jgi:ElaB/YqjD/DUF883 family membrane-anchored ribosome-binding protein
MSITHNHPEKTKQGGNSSSAPTTEYIRSTAHEMVDNAADRAEDVEKKVRVEAARVAEKAEASKAEAEQLLRKSLKKVDSFVHQRPVAVAGIAFAAGMFATMLLKR